MSESAWKVWAGRASANLMAIVVPGVPPAPHMGPALGLPFTFASPGPACHLRQPLNGCCG